MGSVPGPCRDADRDGPGAGPSAARHVPTRAPDRRRSTDRKDPDAVSVPARGRAGGGPASSGVRSPGPERTPPVRDPRGLRPACGRRSTTAAIGAPTRLSITSATSRIRSRPWARAVTRSPALTLAAGFAAGAVEPHVPAAARLGRLGAGLEDPHRPEPAVDPRRLHAPHRCTARRSDGRHAPIGPPRSGPG